MFASENERFQQVFVLYFYDDFAPVPWGMGMFEDAFEPFFEEKKIMIKLIAGQGQSRVYHFSSDFSCLCKLRDVFGAKTNLSQKKQENILFSLQRLLSLPCQNAFP